MKRSNNSLPCANFRQQAGMNRRGALVAGAAGFMGLSLASLLAAQQAQSAETKSAPASSRPGFGKAKRCIFFLMWGGPSQLDTFDMKPNAPDSVRGSFKPVSTNVPGLQICEHFQKLNAHADKLAVIRSLSHTDPAHLSSGHTAVTGQLAPTPRSDDAPPSAKDSPHLGALAMKYLSAPNNLPASVILPWKAYHPGAPGGQAPGQHGGWLGPAYDPLLASGDPNQPNWRIPALELASGITPQVLDNRFELLKSLDAQRAMLEQSANARRLDGQQHQAIRLLSSPEVRTAFDLDSEPANVRDRYGRNTHGQCVLLARRLAESGVPLVTINWHNDGKNFWDTHGDNFNRLKNELIPSADAALAALLEDLSSRGMLEDTLIAWIGEFGRRPQITATNSGREHWPFCYSGLLAGGGIAGGAIYGASDNIAAYPTQNPTAPQDFMATVLHALGIHQDSVLHDRSGRPHNVYGGRPIDSLFT